VVAKTEASPEEKIEELAVKQKMTLDLKESF
jgi:hypothetical protein